MPHIHLDLNALPNELAGQHDKDLVSVFCAALHTFIVEFGQTSPIEYACARREEPTIIVSPLLRNVHEASHRDRKEAVERAATAISFAVVREMDDWKTIERLPSTGSGMDYILQKHSDDRDLFGGEGAIGLEVTGTIQDQHKTLNTLINAKVRRLETSGQKRPALIVAVNVFRQRYRVERYAG